MKKPKQVFIAGEISPEFIAEKIAKHQHKTEIGAHNIFLGQVRADVVNEKKVTGIDFSTYKEMAEKQLIVLREKAFEKFDMTCMHIYHSEGFVPVGGVCIFVFVSAPHRNIVYEATEWIVNQVKTEIPIFGKEVFEDDSHQWKVNQ